MAVLTLSEKLPDAVVLIHGLIGILNEPEILRPFGRHPVLAPPMLGYDRFVSRDISAISLEDQADHIAETMSRLAVGRAHLVGHSIGWVVCQAIARRHPSLVRSLVNVEGNFTLADAFWSSRIAEMPMVEVEDLLGSYRKAPVLWISNSIDQPDARAIALAARMLNRQPALTIRAMARSIVERTRAPRYLSDCRDLMQRFPVALIAGSRSVSQWDVPAWAPQLASACLTLPGLGHLMMLEEPARFAKAVLQCVAANTDRQTAWSA